MRRPDIYSVLCHVFVYVTMACVCVGYHVHLSAFKLALKSVVKLLIFAPYSLFQHMPLTRQLTSSPLKIFNSSDTEQLETPPRKRFRENDEDTSSCSLSNSPRKRRMLQLLDDDNTVH